jgi:polysaccharide biosynthesis/export protein
MRYFLLFVTVVVAFQQVCATEIDPTLLKLKELASTSSTMGANKAINQSTTNLIDNSINPETYYIGGGDIFSIHVVELPSIDYTVTIDQNCDAVISEFGIFKLGKRTLSQAKTALIDYFHSKLKKNYEIYASLIRSKTAIISVTGAGITPGTYQVEGTFRILDVLALGNNRLFPSAVDYNYREVVRTNRDTITTFDLFRFMFQSDETQNPYVYPGDNIHIYPVSKQVSLTGNVKHVLGTTIAIRSNETIKDFLSLFTLETSADSANIIVTKHDNNGVPRTIVFSLIHPENIVLEDRDMIFVSPKSKYPRIETIQLMGEIDRPGQYPLVNRTTTAMAAIEQAGGPTQFGNAKRAFILRRHKITDMDKSLVPQPIVQPTTVSNPRPPIAATNVRAEINSAMSNISSSKDYSIISLKNRADKVFLEPNDEVVIPATENFVYVSGNVKSPGAYAFVKGCSPSYFVKQAGGRTKKGDRSNIFIMSQYADAYQIKESEEVEEGDIIVVPESQQYKFLSTVFLPILGAFFAAINAAWVVYSIVKQ